MKKQIKIVPAILVNSKADFKKQFDKVKADFKYIQIDIMDGELVKTKNDIRPSTISPMVRGYRLEIHLMVKDVAKYIEIWKKMSSVEKIIFHFEAEKDAEATIGLAQYLKKNKIKAGLAINPNTPLYKIKNTIKYFDTIQVMGVTPGKQGQKFQPKTLAKIKGLRSKYKNLNIAVDGGINDKNFEAIKKAGANIISIGSYLQKSKNLKEALNKLV